MDYNITVNYLEQFLLQDPRTSPSQPPPYFPVQATQFPQPLLSTTTTTTQHPNLLTTTTTTTQLPPYGSITSPSTQLPPYHFPPLTTHSSFYPPSTQFPLSSYGIPPQAVQLLAPAASQPLLPLLQEHIQVQPSSDPQAPVVKVHTSFCSGVPFPLIITCIFLLLFCCLLLFMLIFAPLYMLYEYIPYAKHDTSIRRQNDNISGITTQYA